MPVMASGTSQVKQGYMNGFDITIDGNNLFNNRLLLIDPAGNTVGGDWLVCDGMLQLRLLPGQYRFSSQATVSDFSFTVNNDGTLGILPETEPFMQVVGGSTLKLKGYRVKVDARYLTGNGVVWPTAHAPVTGDGLDNGFVKNEIINLLPGMAYYVQSAAGMVGNFFIKLTLNNQWQVLNPATMAPDAVYDRFITVINDAYIPELILMGYPLLIDGRSAKHSLLLMDLDGDRTKGANHTAFDNQGVLFVNLLPQRQQATGFAEEDLYRFSTETNGYSHPGFYITNEGEVAFDPIYDLYFDVDKFNGLTRLTVRYPMPELIA
jgi:hypothetical protein